jgi:hypothetical protein
MTSGDHQLIIRHHIIIIAEVENAVMSKFGEFQATKSNFATCNKQEKSLAPNPVGGGENNILGVNSFYAHLFDE